MNSGIGYLQCFCTVNWNEGVITLKLKFLKLLDANRFSILAIIYKNDIIYFIFLISYRLALSFAFKARVLSVWVKYERIVPISKSESYSSLGLTLRNIGIVTH